MKSKITRTINISTIINFFFITVFGLFILDVPKTFAETIIRDSSPSQNKYLHIPWCRYPYRCPINDEPWVLDNRAVGSSDPQYRRYDGNYFYECGSDLHLGHCTRGQGGRQSEGLGQGHGSWIGASYEGGWVYAGSSIYWATHPPISTANKVLDKMNQYGYSGSIIWGKSRPDHGCYDSPVKQTTVEGKTYYGLAADTTLFRNEFTLSESDVKRISSVRFFGVADDWMKVWINGNPIAETVNTIGVIDNISIPTGFFQSGRNVIAIQASNKGYWWPNPTIGDFNQAGLYYKLTINLSPAPPTPTVDIKANGSDGPITIQYQDYVTLSWTSRNADSCTASGSWSGTKATSGSESIQLNQVKTHIFTITCYDSTRTRSETDSVQVIVRAKPPAVITKPAVITY